MSHGEGISVSGNSMLYRMAMAEWRPDGYLRRAAESTLFTRFKKREETQASPRFLPFYLPQKKSIGFPNKL